MTFWNWLNKIQLHQTHPLEEILDGEKLMTYLTFFLMQLISKPRGFISEPLKSGAGYHLIQLTDKRGPFVEYQDQWKVRQYIDDSYQVKG